MGNWGDYDCTRTFCGVGRVGCSNCRYGRRKQYFCDKCTNCGLCCEPAFNLNCDHNTEEPVKSKCKCPKEVRDNAEIKKEWEELKAKWLKQREELQKEVEEAVKQLREAEGLNFYDKKKIRKKIWSARYKLIRVLNQNPQKI